MSIRGVLDYAHHIGPGCPHLYFPPGLHLGCLTAEPWFVARSRIKLPTKKCELCQCCSPHSQKSGRSYLLNKRKGRLFVIVFFNLYLLDLVSRATWKYCASQKVFRPVTGLWNREPLKAFINKYGYIIETTISYYPIRNGWTFWYGKNGLFYYKSIQDCRSYDLQNLQLKIHNFSLELK